MLKKESDFNCGGYALGTFDWIQLKSLFGFGIVKCKEGEKLEEVTKEAVEELLEEFDYIRVVDRENEVTKEEFLVYFRISDDGDFHFLKKTHSGKIYHKPGSFPVCKFSGNPYVDDWSVTKLTNYCGPIILFAVSNSHYM